MQEKGLELERARAARSLRELRDITIRLETEMQGYKDDLETALRAGNAASEAGDREEEGRQLGIVRMINDTASFRLAAMQRSQNQLQAALRDGSLTLDDPLDEYSLDDAQFAALEDEVLQFQDEYLQLFERCKEIEGL
jgi:hypothetical protein